MEKSRDILSWWIDNFLEGHFRENSVYRRHYFEVKMGKHWLLTLKLARVRL